VKETARNPSAPDLIDRIGEALPADVRADFYREMRHCRSLPENDEMLRILRAMMFLTLLMEGVPDRVLEEREKLQQLFAQGLRVLREMLEAGKTYHQQLELRLTQLPDKIAEGISPEAIAASVNESLRQQFVRSTIPRSAEALGRISTDLRTVVTEFGQTAKSLGDSYSGAAASARRAIGEIESAISRAAGAARHAVEELSTTFHREYRWSLYALSCLALVVGIALGMLLQRALDPPQEHVAKSAVQATQPAPKIDRPAPPPRNKR
jgi:hypothetical protein